MPAVENIPPELRERDQWVCWVEERRGDKVTKIPKRPDGSGENARSNDMATWGSFDEAWATAQERDGWGIGFMFSEADPYTGIDLDGCLDGPESPADWLPSIEAFDKTYIERSPSGEGLHSIVRDTSVPSWWKNQKEGEGEDERGVELYSSGRYFTFTGDTLENFGSDSIERVPELNEWLTAAYLVFNDSLPADQDQQPGGGGDVDVSVYDVISQTKYPEGERREHPVHGSSTGSNFMVDPGGETWRCWRDGTTGDAIHLIGMEAGLIECGDWDDGPIDEDTWRDVFAEARDRGYIEEIDDDDAEEFEEPDVTPGRPTESVWEDIRNALREATNPEEKARVRRRVVQFLRRHRSFATHEESDTLYVFNHTGIYEPRGEQVIKRTLVRNLNSFYSVHERNEITDQIRGFTYMRPEEFGGPEGKISVANGVLDMETFELKDDDPDHMFLSSLPVEYDPDAEAPLWEEFLEDVVPKQIDRMKLQEYAGYTLMHWSLKYQKALFIVGPTASGKSTFLDTIRGMLGRDAVSSVTPQELVDERFAAVELFGAWANIRNDIPSGVIENTGKFKELTAGDPIKAERKYEPTFTFDPKAKHLYSANQLPDASVDDDAFYRRIMLISFPSTIPVNDRDPHLRDKLQEQLSGILNWAIEGYKRLEDQEEFTGARSPSEVRKTWESWGSTVERFKQEAFVKEPDGFVPKSVAHKAYVRFCEEKGLPAADSQNQMTRKLKGDKDIEDGRRSVDGKRVRCYFGVELVDEWDPRSGESEKIPDEQLDEFGAET